MDFKTEYKAAAESMTPSREQLDRMKANILRQTAKPRKPAFTRAAYIGGTVAACAVITLTAVTLLPVLKDAGKLTNSDQSVLAGSSAPETSANNGIAFWDNEIKAMVIVTHGMVKKTQKTPKKEIAKAERIRQEYYNEKNK